MKKTLVLNRVKKPEFTPKTAVCSAGGGNSGPERRYAAANKYGSASLYN
jgi:hypothetical protein